MNWEQILESIFAVLNSPAAITLYASVVLYILNRVYAVLPASAKYEGSIITAVKAAEIEISKENENAGADRLEFALDFIVKIYEEVEKKRASTAVIANLKEGIQIVHDRLEKQGTLK